MRQHSFVIPAYKNSPYLESCIQSLINQTIKSEVVLTTSTPSLFIENIAKKYDLAYHISNEPSSIATDWNFALSKASHSLVTIAHQDDIYERTYSEHILKEIEKRGGEDVLIAFTNYSDLVNNEDRGFSLNALVKSVLLLPIVISKRLKSQFFKKSILLFGDPICCPAVTINMGAMQNEFRFSTEYTCALDWYAWLEISKREGSFLFINKKLMKHRIHIDSETTSQINNGKRQQEELQIFELMWGKTLAKLITKVYSLGYKSNRVF